MERALEAKPGHLLVTLTGDFSLAEARTSLEEMVAQCQAHGLQAVLIDGRGLTNLVSIGDRFDIATLFAGMKSKIKVAVLVADWQHFTKTLEHAAVNRGALLRTTTSEAEARAFLGLE